MRCSVCGLRNFQQAASCRRCGGQLVDTHPPPPGSIPPLPPMHVGRDAVTVAKEASWPPLCVKCGVHGSLESRDVRYTWFPPWTYALLVFGLLPAAIVQWLLTKQAGFTHAICGACNARWSLGRATYTAAFCVPVVGAFVLVIAGVATGTPAVIGVGALALLPGIVVLPMLAYWLVLRPRALRALFIDDHFVTLAGVAHPVLAEMRGQTT
jgi:hypothetical protein